MDVLFGVAVVVVPMAIIALVFLVLRWFYRLAMGGRREPSFGPPVGVPGDIRNDQGDLWMDRRHSLRWGRLAVNRRQAQEAEAHGWKPVRELDRNYVIVERSKGS